MWPLIESFFVYDPQRPLIFSSPQFWVFFGFAILIYQLIYKQITLRNLFLLFFSLFFYYKAGGFFFFLILFSTVVDYFIGNAIYSQDKQRTRTWLLVLSLVINLGLLSYYKYTYFFTELINSSLGTDWTAQDYLALMANQFFGTGFNVEKIILPVGISFYTFQTLSYTLDIYRGKLQPVKNILDFAFYVSFFPQLVAGPIVRASSFVPQIYQEFKLNSQEYGAALFMILNGLIKKILISDYISVNFVDRVFESPGSYTGFESLLAVYGYAIQIYCDFSGYTDIAIGLALLLGFRLNINFNSPYVATSITDFWRRWHISLSTWLRDYLYISLGGNRSISTFTYMSVPMIFFSFLWIDGWEMSNFFFFVGIVLLWLLYLASGENKIFAYVDLVLINIFCIESARMQNWYLFGFSLLIFFLWILYLIKPQIKISLSTYANLSITMLLGGLWHGAAARFIIWGALHGIALAVHKLWMDLTGTKGQAPKGFRKFLGQFLTFHLVCYCWIYFRASDLQKVNQILYQISSDFALISFSDAFNFKLVIPIANFNLNVIAQVLSAYPEVFILMALAYIIHFLPPQWKEKVQHLFIELPDFARALVIAVVVVILYQARTADIQPFIYFQF